MTREDREIGAARDVRPEPDAEARLQVAARAASRPRRGTGSTTGQWATRVSVSTSRASSRSDRWTACASTVRAPEPAGPVVDVDVVERLGEQAGHLGDLAAVLGDVGLPVRAGRRGERRRLAQELGRTRDREPRRDRVAQAAVVARRASAR